MWRRLMAAYIDLNPVRAKLVEGAEDWRWSGWSAALAGDKEAIAGLCDVLHCTPKDWVAWAKGVYAEMVSERRSDIGLGLRSSFEVDSVLGLRQKSRHLWFSALTSSFSTSAAGRWDLLPLALAWGGQHGATSVPDLRGHGFLRVVESLVRAANARDDDAGLQLGQDDRQCWR
jgi:hypothetical protein